MVNGTTKTHPTAATKGDVSYLQCKAVGRNLQDLKRIAAQEFLSDVYLEYVKTMTLTVAKQNFSWNSATSYSPR